MTKPMIHFAQDNDPICKRARSWCNLSATWSEVTCKSCLKLKPAPIELKMSDADFDGLSVG